MTSQEAEKKYGKIENGKWSDEAKHMIVCKIPVEYNSSWINTATGKPTTKIYINKDAAPMLLAALKNLKECNLLQELKTFDGCFVIRDVRAVPGQSSFHSWGIAIDVNAKENGLGKEPKLSPEFVACFTKAGWTWGGNFKRKDGMHFSLGG